MKKTIKYAIEYRLQNRVWRRQRGHYRTRREAGCNIQLGDRCEVRFVRITEEVVK